MKALGLITIAASFAYCTALAQHTEMNLPAIVKKQNGAYSLLVNGKPFIVLGAQLWNSSAWYRQLLLAAKHVVNRPATNHMTI